MAGLADFRAQHPEYNDMPDASLADALYKKFYSDMPREQFDAKMGTQQGPQADTAADSAKRGLPPMEPADFSYALMHPSYVRGYAANRANDPTQLTDTLKGIPTGIAGSVAGLPGNIEAAGRFLLSKVAPVSRQTMLPTSSQVENSIGGPPTIGDTQGGRMLGEMLGPGLLVKGVQKAGQMLGPLAANTLGMTTGSGGEAIKEAFRAGQEGGQRASSFTDAMRGNVSPSDVVDEAKAAVQQLGQARSAAYRAGIGSTIKGDPTVLDFQPIKDAVDKVAEVGTFKGQTLSAGAQKVADTLKATVDEWGKLDPTEYHTAEGIDALKQKIGNLAYEEDLRALTAPRSPGAKIVGNVYGAIKGQIVSQAPGYAKVMKDYSDATDEIRNIESTLSLNPKASVDTSLRKLQSILRNNANTNYGQRAELGNVLNDVSGGKIIPQLAGQALNSPTPRAINAMGDIAAIGGAALAGHPGALAAVPLTSPRLVGEGAYLTGRILPNANKISPIAGGMAGVPSLLNPRMQAMMGPGLLSHLLNQTPAYTP